MWKTYAICALCGNMQKAAVGEICGNRIKLTSLDRDFLKTKVGLMMLPYIVP